MATIFSDKKILLLERLVIVILAGLYLFFFRTPVPNGDGLVYIGNITNAREIWNPNHLLMDPIGDVFCRFLWWFGFDLSPFHALKILSGLATLASLVIFHAVLSELGITSTASRLLSVAGLFFSRNFISMGLSEEYFMIQMPLLMIVLWSCARWAKGTSLNPLDKMLLISIGLLLGATAAIAINNLFLVMTLGIGIAVTRSGWRRIAWRSAFSVWVAAGVVLLPLLLFGYVRADVRSGFLSWLTAYQGQSASALRSLYGVEWSLKGIALSFGRLTYNLFANFIDLGGIGTVVKSKVFSIPLDFTPDYTMVMLGGAILTSLIILLLLLILWIFREGIKNPFIRVGLAWIAGYMLFNFYWNDSSDQFYFQILPIAWLFLPLAAGTRNSETGIVGEREERQSIPIQRVFPLVLIVMIMTLNTLNIVAPAAFEDVEGKRKAHREILHAGDLEIVPGWDGLAWMSPGDGVPLYQRMALMDLAMQSGKGPSRMELLPVLIRDHLLMGRRVVIARLYNLDGIARPWDQLRKLGWPRDKVRILLKEFNSREIGRIGDVIFCEISLKNPSLPMVTN